MSVFRVHKTKNFSIISNLHFKEKGMSLKAKGLLSLMLSLPDDWNYSVSGLVKLSKDGKDSVMSALGELEEFGYLERIRTIDSKGRFSGIEYNIFEQSQPKKPIADNQQAENENVENENAEKPPQLKTNKIKELKNKDIKELSTNEFEGVLEDIVDLELKELYKDYIEMREQMGSPLTKRGLTMLIDRCDRLSNFDNAVKKALLETAIINNWRNVYTPKDEERIGRNGKLEELKKFYTDD